MCVPSAQPNVGAGDVGLDTVPDLRLFMWLGQDQRQIDTWAPLHSSEESGSPALSGTEWCRRRRGQGQLYRGGIA